MIKKLAVLLVGMCSFALSSQAGLIEAVEQSDEQAVAATLADGEDANQLDNLGRPVLNLAIDKANIQVIKQLLQAGANVNGTNSEKVLTPLGHSCLQGNEEAAKLLIDHGADVNKEVPLSTAISAYLRDKKPSQLSIVKLLLKKGAKANKANRTGRTPLMVAVDTPNTPDEIWQLLEEAGALKSVNVINKNGDTALMLASKQGNTPVVGKLLAQGATLKARNSQGRDALTLAAQKGHNDIVQTLLEAGADPNDTTTGKLTVLMIASSFGKQEVVNTLLKSGADVNAADTDGWTAMRWASEGGWENIVDTLRKAGATRNVSPDGNTSLIRLLIQGKPEEAKPYIYEVNVNALGTNGWTALRVAATQGYDDIVSELILAGADINAADKNGWTPLMLAASNNHVKTVGVLLDDNSWYADILREDGDIEQANLIENNKIDINAKNNQGWSALSLAKARKYTKMVKLLEQAGAK